MNIGFSNPAVIGFYGFSQTGKTTLILRLIRDFKKDGLSIAVVKRTEKRISSEPCEKDTSEYRAAGAILTSFSSESETNFVTPKRMRLNKILERINTFIGEIDLVIIEGAYEPNIPKIRLGEIPIRENTKMIYDDNYFEVKKFITKLIKRSNNV